MIGRSSNDSQHQEPVHHLANVFLSFFRYSNDDLRNDTNQRHLNRKWTREDNKHTLHSYFRNNQKQKENRKRMIEVLEEYATFEKTRRRLIDQVRTIIKKGCFSDLEILDIKQKMKKGSSQQGPNAIINTKYQKPKKSLTQINCTIITIKTIYTQKNDNKHKKKK